MFEQLRSAHCAINQSDRPRFNQPKSIICSSIVITIIYLLFSFDINKTKIEIAHKAKNFLLSRFFIYLKLNSSKLTCHTFTIFFQLLLYFHTHKKCSNLFWWQMCLSNNFEGKKRIDFIDTEVSIYVGNSFLKFQTGARG